MKYVIAPTLLLLYAASLQAQPCSCRDELLWVKQFMEKNHPGYNTTIKNPQQPEYKKFADSLAAAASGTAQGRYCIAYLKKYIAYLKDHHSNIYKRNGNGLPVNEQSPAVVDSFLKSEAYLQTETVTIDSAALVKWLSKSTDPVEGVYATADSTYIVAVLKSKTTHRNYYGIILNSKSLLWPRGKVKFELKQAGGGLFTTFFAYRNHSVQYEEGVQLKKGRLIFSTGVWHRQGTAGTRTAAESISTGVISFRVLDSVTGCLSIRSFSGDFSTLLDSAYKKILPQIRRYPRLIIDVRNNSGGSDANFAALQPLMYTDTIVSAAAQLYATADNKTAYQKMLDLYKSDKARYGATGYTSWEYPLNRMKTAAADSFVYFTTDKPIRYTYKPDTAAPRKIAILYNRGCASSCEQLLLDALFSKKTILVGENSGGYIAYGNVMHIETPCGYMLDWTTTRSLSKVTYEFVGVPPHHTIPETESNWLEYTRKLLAR